MIMAACIVSVYADTTVDTFEALVVGGLTKVSISWEEVQDASYYEVSIDTSTDYYDIKENVVGNSYDWAPDYYITPDMPFVLTVNAYDENGSIISKSEAVTFYIVVAMCDYWGCYGDVDDDKMATVVDATYIQQHLAKLHTFDYFKSCQADTDGDGMISIIDATYIQQFCAQIFNSNSRVGQDLWVGAVNYDIMFEQLV